MATDHTHNALIHTCSRAGDLERVENLIRQLLNSIEGVRANTVTFNTVIHACGRAGKPDRASYWFDELVRYGLTPNEHTFGALLNAWAEAGDHEKMAHYQRIMEDFGFGNTAVSYNTLIKACAHRGDVSRAESLFQQMVEQGHQVSLITYNSLIHTCTQAGDIARAEEYLQLMNSRGIHPNLITYNTVINACAANGDATRAEGWLIYIIKLGLQPNEVTYGTICKAFARKGEVLAVERIMEAFAKSGQTLNEYFFASLISACGTAQPPDTDRAEQAFLELVSRGLRPQSVRRVLSRAIGEKRAQALIERANRKNGQVDFAGAQHPKTAAASAAMSTAGDAGDHVQQRARAGRQRHRAARVSRHDWQPHGRADAEARQRMQRSSAAEYSYNSSSFQDASVRGASQNYYAKSSSRAGTRPL
mmetsp:Transcript_109686/g.200933  ORF Transcript_109686/g.200933 Transcript_109686/m.200933 type:complete len:419 (+) Transcript_109686:2-1258(+)